MSRAPHALRIRDYRRLWAAGGFSGLGAGMLVVAIPAHVYAVTGSVLATGVTLAVEHLPALLLGPVSGVLADRWDRRRLMIATDLVLVSAISVVLLARTPETIWLVYVAALGQGVAAVLFRPAARAHIPAVVGTGPALTSANAVSAVTTGVVGLAGPPLGGLLFATYGIEAVIGAAAASGLLSATAIATTAPHPHTPPNSPPHPHTPHALPDSPPHPPDSPPRPHIPADSPPCAPAPHHSPPRAPTPSGREQPDPAPPGSPPRPPTPHHSPPRAPTPSGREQPDPAAPDWGGERPGPAAPAFSVRAAVREGLLLVRRAPVTRGLLAANGVYLLANAALTALLIPFGIATFGGSTEVGYLLSALGLGFLIGAPVSRRLVDRFAPRPVVATAQALVGAAFLLLFNSASLPVALAAAVLLGLPGVTVLVAVQTHVQRATPGAILGRVTAVFLTVEAAASMVGAFAGPALSEASGLPVALNAACAVALLSAPVTLFLTPAGAGRLR